MKTLLLVTLLLPAAAAVLAGLGRTQARCWALAASLATLVGAVVLVARFHVGDAAFAASDYSWFKAAGIPLDIRFNVALDGLGLWLFALTALLLVVAVLISWDAIKEQQSLYYRLLLLLGTGMLGVFVARDIILFYLFFEFTLVPLFFLIGIWGSDQRRYAAIKFFLFTLAGSVLTLLGPADHRALGLEQRRRASDDVFHPGLDGPPASPSHALSLAGLAFLCPLRRVCHQGPVSEPGRCCGIWNH